jgi:hypothetical protein
MAITRDQIYTVANTLNTQGTRPTLAAVRRMLGAGSFTTISDALNEWRMLQSTETDSTRADLPASFIERLNTFGSALWLDAMAVATNRFSMEKEVMEEKNREKEIYYKELNTLAEEYNETLEAAKAEIENLHIQKETANKRILCGEEDTKQTHQLLMNAEAARVIAEDRSTELRIELDQTKQKLDQLQNSFLELAGKLESMQNQLLEQFSQPRRTIIKQTD